MVRVLMVCLGNICRSPLAEGILKSKVNTETIFVDSAGTGGWHVGELPDIRSMEVARKNQIDISDQRCRKFSVQDFTDFDLIYVMDSANLRDVLNLAGSQYEIDKVKLILNEMEPGMDKEVPDPYYGGNNGFDLVFEMLDAACEVIAKKIEK
ncbi:low molecular weight protein-tyrosine-phosphatase [Lutimonas zeaxanthinifaciens]|uniref:low molecular weight protein-tyrosine-phosphatase n=1 Tax=Lutimonas zeaxanthinifaciens TaxID=3060215 RepID=UPI00265CA7CA|nr:low molecular weight protein-tyrosine-phosphatase [Lutimonas sp. YSD2104]WKK65033.1 low molecular weight protein-tyrosine-phosphatase [Lutimonas sp. YSD2104]